MRSICSGTFQKVIGRGRGENLKNPSVSQQIEPLTVSYNHNNHPTLKKVMLTAKDVTRLSRMGSSRRRRFSAYAVTFSCVDISAIIAQRRRTPHRVWEILWPIMWSTRRCDTIWFISNTRSGLHARVRVEARNRRNGKKKKKLYKRYLNSSMCFFFSFFLQRPKNARPL